MAIDQVVASLLRIPLFADLKPPQVAEIARRAGRCAFRYGDIIIKAGEAGEAAYLVLSGDVVCRADPGPRTPVEPVTPGSLVGELAMLVDHAYGATVVAEDWVDCLKLERAALHAQMRADPDLAKRLAQVIRRRLTLVATELQAIDELLASVAGRKTTPLQPTRSLPAGVSVAR
ncbi:MAG TPA: cyclic nucleotide-binding domain-containing protein [Hyphomicrobiaceae bacterium]|jgi:CRP-like cAMP-binding protein|nr:cyclic nucleotide-binding domain-containing protein [Hyphomicrobiaceae bacterium]